MIPLSPRLLVLAGVAGALAVSAVGLYVKGRSDASAKWKPRVEAAQVQTKVEQATTKALDQYTTEIRIIRERSDAAATRVQEAPGADAPLPGAVRDAWLAGVRHDGKDAADHDPGQPPR